MARITVEDCLTKVPNRFLLVNMVSRRVRQIREGSEYLVNSPKNEDVVVALREVAAGKVTLQEEPPKIEMAAETEMEAEGEEVLDAAAEPEAEESPEDASEIESES